MNTASTSLRGLARDVADLPRVAMISAAKASKKIIDEQGRRIAGADGLTGKKKRGLKLRARDDIRTSGNVTRCRIQGSVPGWIWVNTGTAPHPIRRRRKGPMRKMTVHHPGTRGRHVWAGIVDRIGEQVPAIFADELHRLVSRG